MATFETWGMDAKLKVRLLEPRFERRIVIALESDLDSGSLRMSTAEAVELRDALSRAIVEAAQQHAQATVEAAQTEGSPA